MTCDRLAIGLIVTFFLGAAFVGMGFIAPPAPPQVAAVTIAASQPALNNQTPQVLAEQKSLADRDSEELLANNRKVIDLQKQTLELCKQMMDLGSHMQAAQCLRDLRDNFRPR